MTFIVHGASGAQGSPVLLGLRAAGKRARPAVRRRGVNFSDGDFVPVDFSDVDSLVEAYTGAEGVFVHLPLGNPEILRTYAHSVVAAISHARPSRVVVSTSGQVVDEPGTALQVPADSPIATLIRDLSAINVPTAVVAPRLYLENLLLPVVTNPVRETGVLRYPLPEHFPASWSSHLDVADVVVALLTEKRSLVGTVAVGHLPGLVGHDLAHAFGPDVRFESTTPSAFGTLVAPLFGREAAAQIASFYELLNSQNGNVIDRRTSAQELLGLVPRSIAGQFSQLLT